jgi:N-acetylglucosaminyl-diphospho-decaprenol L-rhamnosyltransferase
MTAGWAIVHVPELEVHHHPSTVRDPHLRRRQGIRNTLWFTWSRRPPRSALRRSVDLGRRLPRDSTSLAAVVDALRGIPWVLCHRRVVPPRVEALYAMVDHVEFRSGARRYGS